MDNLHKKLKRNGNGFDGRQNGNNDGGIDMVIRKIQNARQSMGQQNDVTNSIPLIGQN